MVHRMVRREREFPPECGPKRRERALGVDHHPHTHRGFQVFRCKPIHPRSHRLNALECRCRLALDGPAALAVVIVNDLQRTLGDVQQRLVVIQQVPHMPADRAAGDVKFPGVLALFKSPHKSVSAREQIHSGPTHALKLIAYDVPVHALVMADRRWRLLIVSVQFGPPDGVLDGTPVADSPPETLLDAGASLAVS